MEEQELFSVLESFKNAIDVLQNRVEEIDKMVHESIEQFDERFHGIESTLYDEILTPANEALEARQLEEEFDAYKGKYGERLGAYDEKLRPLEGEDFDLTRKAFDQWKAYTPQEGDEGFDEAGYVDALIEHVEEQLKAIKEIAGVSEDSEVTAKVDEDGNTEIAVDGETVATDSEVTEEEASAEASAEEAVDESLEEGELSEEEMKDLEEEMKKEGLI